MNLLYIGVLLAGIGIGKLLNVVIVRVPQENGDQRIPGQSMMVALGNGILWVLCGACFGEENPAYGCAMAVACSLLVCVFWIDFNHMLIYNRFVILLVAVGGVAIFTDPITAPWDHGIGLAAGGGVFLLLYFGAWLLRKREGLGFGDVKLAAVLGLLLGWQKFLLAMLIGSVLGSLVLVCLNRLRGSDRETEYPFGPFMVIGTICGIFWGGPVIEWYGSWLLG